jgi:hypothetical protein
LGTKPSFALGTASAHSTSVLELGHAIYRRRAISRCRAAEVERNRANKVDAGGTIVGIEILEIQLPGQIAIAREFAAAHGLAFPRDLAGNLVAA